MQGTSPNRPLGKTRKSGSKFDLQQDSSAVLYRVSANFYKGDNTVEELSDRSFSWLVDKNLFKTFICFIAGVQVRLLQEGHGQDVGAHELVSRHRQGCNPATDRQPRRVHFGAYEIQFR